MLFRLIAFLSVLLGCGRMPGDDARSVRVELQLPAVIQTSEARTRRFWNSGHRLRVLLSKSGHVLCERWFSTPLAVPPAISGCSLSGVPVVQVTAILLEGNSKRSLAEGEARFRPAEVKESGILLVALALRVPVSEFDDAK